MTTLALAASGYAVDIAGKFLVLKTKDGLAIQGYDPVAYFTDNKAAKGNAKFSSEYEGAEYLFASVEHKNLFDGNPAKYAPAPTRSRGPSWTANSLFSTPKLRRSFGTRTCQAIKRRRTSIGRI